jgi:competence protein CoiA
MLCAQNPIGQVIAWEVDKDDGPFVCPECGKTVILKKGIVRTHHFAHIPPTDCQYGNGESDAHRQAKAAIYTSLSTNPLITRLQLERPLGEVRPDISFYFGKTPIAIEVQISTLSMEVILRRTAAYTQKSIYLLWTPPYSPSIMQDKRYAPRQWEKFLHALYFGKILYWKEDEILLPVTLDRFMIEVPVNYWYEEGGVLRQEGGYSYPSKRYKTPRALTPIRITELSAITRSPWASSSIQVPAARLWSTPRI